MTAGFHIVSLEGTSPMPLTAASLTLADLKPGEHATLVEIHSGRGITGRMTSLGFTPGVELVMTQNYGHGPLLVTVRGMRVALGRGEAEKLLVQRSAA
jgi:ferrous iron transport protein A